MGMLFLSGVLLLGKIKCTLCLKVSVAIPDKAFIIYVLLRSELGKAQVLHPVSAHHDLLRHKQKMLMQRASPTPPQSYWPSPQAKLQILQHNLVVSRTLSVDSSRILGASSAVCGKGAVAPGEARDNPARSLLPVRPLP